MRNSKGFTLIELMIVIAIIAIIAAIAIPGILSARRSANAGSALANLKSFSTAMATYAQDSPTQSYPADSSTTSLGDYYSHISPKGGYRYEYKTNTATPYSKFVYVTYPVSVNNGTKAFFVDESNRIYEMDVTSDTKLPAATSSATVDVTATTANAKVVIGTYTSAWKAKS